MPPGPGDIAPDDPYVEIRRGVQLWLVGIECGIRQESQDEVYGTVSVIIPSTKSSTVHHFPSGTDYLTMGEDGTRTVALNVLAYEGPPADVVISSLLIEHDSGDLDEYRRQIAAKIAEAAAMGAAAFGVPAEAVAANQGLLGDISLGLVNVLSGWVGADDDPYNPQTTRIAAKDLLTAYAVANGQLPRERNPFPMRSIERPDTPGVRLDFNVDPVRVSGTDQGGDTGHYAFYYRTDLFVDGHKVL